MMRAFSWLRFGVSFFLMLVTFMFLAGRAAHAEHGRPLPQGSYHIAMYCHDLDMLNALMELPADGTFQGAVMKALETGDCVSGLAGSRFVLSEIEKVGEYTDPLDATEYIIIKGKLPLGGVAFTSVSPRSAEIIFGQET